MTTPVFVTKGAFGERTLQYLFTPTRTLPRQGGGRTGEVK
jgi:hypothetical protein